MGECAVCGKKIVDADLDLCPRHLGPYRLVREAYTTWAMAYGQLSHSDYLQRLSTRPETGSLAKEIAQFLLKNPDRWN